jgi:hypothetical protein
MNKTTCGRAGEEEKMENEKLTTEGGDNRERENDSTIISQVLNEIRIVEAKFAKIQENPALNSPENGLTDRERELLEKLICDIGEANLAAKEIMKRLRGDT